MKYYYQILRPGGNDTALVYSLINNPNKRKQINDNILQQNPNIEQVGFVDLSENIKKLLMAGSEFCGNATRSTAWLALQGRVGECLH